MVVVGFFFVWGARAASCSQECTGILSFAKMCALFLYVKGNCHKVVLRVRSIAKRENEMYFHSCAFDLGGLN